MAWPGLSPTQRRFVSWPLSACQLLLRLSLALQCAPAAHAPAGRAGQGDDDPRILYQNDGAHSAAARPRSFWPDLRPLDGATVGQADDPAALPFHHSQRFCQLDRLFRGFVLQKLQEQFPCWIANLPSMAPSRCPPGDNDLVSDQGIARMDDIACSIKQAVSEMNPRCTGYFFHAN